MAGINVAWDFVELPSQIMQNWTWEEEALSLFSGHYETGEPLPKDLYERLRSARTFMGGWRQMRQLSLGHLDLRLHRDPPDAVTEDLMSYIEALFKEHTPSAEFARMNSTTSFTHLFSGGYAAAYYSYLWSEVLDADAFGRFRREGIFNREVGEAYLGAILTRATAMTLKIFFANLWDEIRISSLCWIAILGRLWRFGHRPRARPEKDVISGLDEALSSR